MRAVVCVMCNVNSRKGLTKSVTHNDRSAQHSQKLNAHMYNTTQCPCTTPTILNIHKAHHTRVAQRITPTISNAHQPQCPTPHPTPHNAHHPQRPQRLTFPPSYRQVVPVGWFEAAPPDHVDESEDDVGAERGVHVLGEEASDAAAALRGAAVVAEHLPLTCTHRRERVSLTPNPHRVRQRTMHLLL